MPFWLACCIAIGDFSRIDAGNSPRWQCEDMATCNSLDMDTEKPSPRFGLTGGYLLERLRPRFSASTMVVATILASHVREGMTTAQVVQLLGWPEHQTLTNWSLSHHYSASGLTVHYKSDNGHTEKVSRLSFNYLDSLHEFSGGLPVWSCESR